LFGADENAALLAEHIVPGKKGAMA